MIDVDHFKAVNDLYGHATGDEVLRGVADVLTQVSRVEDVVARYGGEEFTILTPGVDADGAVVLAERARHAIEALSVSRGATVLKVTCSFGIAGYDANAKTSILDQADAAMYAAKNAGRNRVMVYAPKPLEQAA